SVAATRYTGSFILRPCSHSCSSVFGSLAVAAMLGLISTSMNKRRTSASAAAYPASRWTAPITASSASARIEGRRLPPERISPSPSRMSSGSPRVTASWWRGSCFTIVARTLVRSPSGRAYRRSYSRADTARLRTESPRNSSRSLWSAEKLRCVSARASSCQSPNWCCKRACSAKSRPSTPALSTLLRLSGVFQQQEGGTEHVDFPVVGELHHHLVAVLGNVEVFAVDRFDVVDIRRFIEDLPHFGHRVSARGLLNGLEDRLVFDHRRERLRAQDCQAREHAHEEQQPDEGNAELP